eukprot:5718785-Lingulodinium_polyedra.AAC.2
MKSTSTSDCTASRLQHSRSPRATRTPPLQAHRQTPQAHALARRAAGHPEAEQQDPEVERH